MNKRLYLIFALLLSCTAIFSQSAIVEDLNNPKSGQGEVRIYQDDAIKSLLVASPQNETPTLENKDTTRTSKAKTSASVKTARGRTYKIQVFSGNDQRRSKDEAYYKKKLINTRFPQLPTRILFDPPTWRVVVGRFSSDEQARSAMSQLKAAFPSFGREMYIVR